MISEEELVRRGGIEWVTFTKAVDRKSYVEVDSEEQFRDLFEHEVSTGIAKELIRSGVAEINQIGSISTAQENKDVYEAKVMIVKNPGWLLSLLSALALAIERLHHKAGRSAIAAKEVLEDAIRQ